MKATAQAPSNIAFIKYWGRKDEEMRLPENGSISMNLSHLTTKTTVEFSNTYTTDEVIIDGKIIIEEQNRVITQLERIRALGKSQYFAKVVSQNSFPSGTGLSSSASGFAALTAAAAKALDLNLSERELSILARQGSGSACRSIPNGFVEWLDGNTSETSYAESLYPPEYWNLCDLVVIVSQEKKAIATSEGQTRVSTSPFFEIRQQKIATKIKDLKQALAAKDFEKLGELSEREAMEMHAVMLTSWPSLIYWMEGTLKLMKQIQEWRKAGVPVFFTLNTGQDVHLLCEEKTAKDIEPKIRELPYVYDTILNYPAVGTKIIDKHLF